MNKQSNERQTKSIPGGHRIMTQYKLDSKTFFKYKKRLDGIVFWGEEGDSIIVMPANNMMHKYFKKMFGIK